MDIATLKLLTKDFKYCSYKVCGKPHWSSDGLFSKPTRATGLREPLKVYCDVVCYAEDTVYEETGKICEVVFNG